MYGLLDRLKRWQLVILVHIDLNRETSHPKFNPYGTQTHELQIRDSNCHIPEMLASATGPSGIIKYTDDLCMHGRLD